MLGNDRNSKPVVFAMGGGLYLVYLIFLMPFEAALSEWLSLV